MVVDRRLLGIGLENGLREEQKVHHGVGLLALFKEIGVFYKIPPLVADAHEECISAQGQIWKDHQCDVVREGGNIWLLGLMPFALDDVGGCHSY